MKSLFMNSRETAPPSTGYQFIDAEMIELYQHISKEPKVFSYILIKNNISPRAWVLSLGIIPPKSRSWRIHKTLFIKRSSYSIRIPANKKFAYETNKERSKHSDTLPINSRSQRKREYWATGCAPELLRIPDGTKGTHLRPRTTTLDFKFSPSMRTYFWCAE